jgi:hypothetical protein
MNACVSGRLKIRLKKGNSLALDHACQKKKSSVSCDRHAMFTGTLLPLLWREQEVTTFAASAAGRTHLGLFVCLFAGPSSGMDRPDEP